MASLVRVMRAGRLFPSYPAAGIGSPMITSMRPGIGARVVRGSNSNAPRIVTGTMSTPALIAIVNAPGLECLQTPVSGTRAFGKRGERSALSQARDDRPETPRGAPRIASIDWKVTRRPQVPSHEGHPEQLPLRHDAERIRQAGEQRRRVD